MEEPMSMLSPRPKTSLLRRRRQTLLMAGAALVFLSAIAFVLAVTTRESSSSAAKNAKSMPTRGGATKLPPRRQSIVVLGDSAAQYGGSAQGWETLLHEEYLRTLDTFNHGLSGYNTRIFLQHAMPGIIEEVKYYYKPAVVVLWFGVNDATLESGLNKAQHVSLDEYKDNLFEMIKQVRKATPKSHVVLLSPAYIDEKQRLTSALNYGRKASDPLDRTNAETVKYANACGEIFDLNFKDDTYVGFIDVCDYFLTNYSRFRG